MAAPLAQVSIFMQIGTTVGAHGRKPCTKGEVSGKSIWRIGGPIELTEVAKFEILRLRIVRLRIVTMVLRAPGASWRTTITLKPQHRFSRDSMCRCRMR